MARPVRQAPGGSGSCRRPRCSCCSRSCPLCAGTPAALRTAAAFSPEAICDHVRAFGVKRVVLPRILAVAKIREIKAGIPCEIETFIFGNHGLMVEGRCSLTNHATGLSTNMDGVCSPAAQVHHDKAPDGSVTTRLGDVTIDRFGPDEQAGYPTICKGRYHAPARDEVYFAFEEPVSLNLAELLPWLIETGAKAFRIAGRQRRRAATTPAPTFGPGTIASSSASKTQTACR